MRSVRAAGLFASRLISDRPYKSSSSQTVLNCWMSLTSFLLCPFQPLYVREALRDCSWRSCDLPRPKVDQEAEWEVLIGALTLKTQWLEPGWRRQNAILINVLINSQNLEKNLFKFFFFFLCSACTKHLSMRGPFVQPVLLVVISNMFSRSSTFSPIMSLWQTLGTSWEGTSWGCSLRLRSSRTAWRQV